MKQILGITMLAGLLLLTGCASPAKVKGMHPQALNLQIKHPYTVAVKSEGGHTTNPLWTSEISDEAFAQAIREGITESGLFRSVITTGTGDYLLSVAIINVDKPMAGFDMTVSMATSWKLTHAATGKVIYQDQTSKSYTATVGDALVAIRRLRLAQEGAARANIEEGLNRISRLELRDNE